MLVASEGHGRTSPAGDRARGGGPAVAGSDAEYNAPMDTVLDRLTAVRGRAVWILLMAIAMGSATTSHTHAGVLGFWVGVGFAVLLAVALFFARNATWGAWAAGIGSASGIGATLADPALGTFLLISVGWVGSRMPWRHLRIYGVPVGVVSAAGPALEGV